MHTTRGCNGNAAVDLVVAGWKLESLSCQFYYRVITVGCVIVAVNVDHNQFADLASANAYVQVLVGKYLLQNVSVMCCVMEST